MTTYTKRNTTPHQDSLIREAEGLHLLTAELTRAGVGDDVHVPEIKSVSHDALQMTAVERKRARPEDMARLGRGLASLHRLEQVEYGLDRDNYIGLSPQKNGFTPEWGRFFADNRLGFQIDRITNPEIRRRFTQVLTKKRETLIEFLNVHCEHPSLVHGDLWAGNALFDASGPWLIDPAVYYGDRETDLAMTELFGGFGAEFYDAYDQVYTRSAVYEQKKPLYNFYHYLNHYNLFGCGYLSGCEQGAEALLAL